MKTASPVTPGTVELFQSEDGTTALEVHLDRETACLTQDNMAELFDRERSVITKHLRNVFKEGELEEGAVCAKFAHCSVRKETIAKVVINLINRRNG